MPGSWRLLSVGLICILSSVPTSYAHVAHSCSLNDDRIQLLLNESSGQYYEPNKNDTLRFLVENGAHHSDAEQQRAEAPLWVEAHPCSCFLFNHTNDAYCPSALSNCERLSSEELEDIKCLGTSPYRNGLRRIMFIGLLWAFGIVVLLLFSSYGIEILNMILNLIIPKYNHFLANRIMRRNPEKAMRLMIENIRFRRRMRRRRPGTDPEWRLEARAVRQLRLSTMLRQPSKTQHPVALRLKVRIYKETEQRRNIYVHGDESDEDESPFDECAICYQDLRTGDRVGDIACGHVFHAGCLKQWCVRRNACPFCQRNDICEPQLSSQEESTEAGEGA